VWGPDIPEIVYTSNERIKSPVDYADHGFIQIASEEDFGQISIVLVERPPRTLLLPAAVAQHIAESEIRFI
jgi:hypothetical protein